MHVSTFYSFKGGVGRTLALVNAAVELAKSGRKVLIVDFDLEAPGIDTFKELQAKPGQLGIVDYVTTYMQSLQPSSVKDFVYEAPISQSESVPGTVWVMPAGKRGPDYGGSLAAINWQSLYGEMEGFLLFEDLKTQWKSQLNPDYVLIDSRTGFTEVGGICTRQLPDMVVILFVPNEQNLQGLKPVVAAIRKENKGPAGKEIAIEFVASNVPMLDDEEDILRTLMIRFAKTLSDKRNVGFEFGRAPVKIHTIQRYDSLHLLNQSIFVIKRPKSRLAKQYSKVMRLLIDNNIDDRDGAIDYLRRQLGFEEPQDLVPKESETRVLKILERHSSDAEILMWAGRYHKSRANTKEAISLLEQSLKIGEKLPNFPVGRVQIELAESLLAEQKPDVAKLHLESAVASSSLDAGMLHRLVYVRQQIDSEALAAIATSDSVTALSNSDIQSLISTMDVSKSWQRVALDLLLARIAKISEQAPTEATDRNLLHYGLLAAIGSGRFDSIDLLVALTLNASEPSLPDLFNAAMGRWAVSGKPSPADFLRVIEEEAQNPLDTKDANSEQCLALAFGVVQQSDEALRRLKASRALNNSLKINRFSCWRYLEVNAIIFGHDLDEIERFILGDDVQPRFLLNDD